jgi:hypothetical protein
MHLFRNEGIGALFDPPYLLKCTHNFFQKYDVANVECEITVNGEQQLTGIAKWQDILKLYEFDKRLVYHLLPKVTDRHVKFVVQNQMKVNLVTKVMSSSVAAAYNVVVRRGQYNCIVSLNGM